jgi:hypothetical protein
LPQPSTNERITQHTAKRCPLSVGNSRDEEKRFQVEIQISTQLKEVLRELTHPYHEKRRKSVRKPSDKWQWDYACDEFVPNYLGHLLHYVEGMLMQMRDRHERETR